MIPACTLELVKESLRTKDDDRLGFMRPDPALENSGEVDTHVPPVQIHYQVRPTEGASFINTVAEPSEKVIGILFVRPAHQTAHPAIFQDLPNFHLRSGSHINFYFPGYGTHWDDRYASDKKEVAKIDGASWYYFQAHYSAFEEELEKRTKWKPTGECELLILSVASNSTEGDAPISFDDGITINISELIADGLISSISRLFYNIFNVFRDNPDTTLHELSNRLAQKNGERAVLDFLGVIPGSSGPITAYKRLKPYAVKVIGPGPDPT